MTERVEALKLASLLLQYPRADLREAARAATELEIDGRRGAELKRFCDWYAATPLTELQRMYVETFDFNRRCSLHLTYHLHGDRRQRGIALAQLKRDYRTAGFEPPGDELPDFLPLMCEFAALAPRDAGLELLERHRVAIELVRAGLRRARSPFAPLLDAVVAALPRLQPAKLARLRRLAAEGPPHEEVGLEPFAPPGVMGWPADAARVGEGT